MSEPVSVILLYSWILLPMPPNASPGLSMGYFGTAWATYMNSKCCHYKMADLNPPWSWWLSQHLPSFCIPWCQPWPFNGPFWNSVWLLVWFPSAATIKWLTWTFQPTMKLVLGPAPAILWGWNCRGSCVFNPITNLKLGWWVEVSHFIVARFGNLRE